MGLVKNHQPILYKGWNITQLYGDDFISHETRIRINQPGWLMESSNLENKLLLISINFTPKTSHSCLKILVHHVFQEGLEFTKHSLRHLWVTCSGGPSGPEVRGSHRSSTSKWYLGKNARDTALVEEVYPLLLFGSEIPKNHLLSMNPYGKWDILWYSDILHIKWWSPDFWTSNSMFQERIGPSNHYFSGERIPSC